MNSLRTRLLASLLLVIALFWAVWFGLQALQTSRDQTGRWDQSLRAIGQQLLLSMPAGSEGMSAAPAYALPEGVRPREQAGPEMSYQVWSREGRPVVLSSGAPRTAFLPVQQVDVEALAQVIVDGTEWRVYALWDDRRALQVQVAKRQRQLDAELGAWLQASLGTALLLMATLGAVTWWTVRWSLRPAEVIGEAIMRRQSLDLRPLPVAGLPRELRPLVNAFNGLLARMDISLHAERRFLADAAHELRTPLAALMAQAQLAMSARSVDDSRNALGPLIGGIQRSARLTEQMLDLARVDASEEDAQSPAHAIHELVALLVHDFDAMALTAGQRLRLYTEPCEANIGTDAIGIIVRNLVDNALRYGGAGATIQVECRPETCGDQVTTVLRVLDNGPGVPLDDRHRIFDRFYRVPGSGRQGSGIGLSLVARVAQVAGATVELGSGLEGRGLGVTVRFRNRQAARGPAATFSPRPGRR